MSNPPTLTIDALYRLTHFFVLKGIKNKKAVR